MSWKEKNKIKDTIYDLENETFIIRGSNADFSCKDVLFMLLEHLDLTIEKHHGGIRLTKKVLDK